MSPSLPPPGTANAPESQFLGTRIRALRKRRDMTLAELAEQSSLTAGYISQLERNLAYPSIPHCSISPAAWASPSSGSSPAKHPRPKRTRAMWYARTAA